MSCWCLKSCRWRALALLPATEHLTVSSADAACAGRAAQRAAWHARRAISTAREARKAADGMRRASALAWEDGRALLPRHAMWVLRGEGGRSFADFGHLLRRHCQAIGFGGYCLITIQWCMEDVLMLRCFGVMCASSMAIFAYFQPQPLMVPVRFNLLFICINGLFIARILMERRDLRLDATEQALWDMGWGAYFTKVQLRELVAVGQRSEVADGTLLAEKGRPIQHRVILILSGEVVLTRNGIKVGSYVPGDFWNESQLLEKSRRQWNQHQVTSAFACNSSFVAWDVEALDEHLSRRPEVRQRLQELWADGYARKLDRSSKKASERAYADILRGILCAGVVGEAELTFLQHVREAQCIPEGVHLDALSQLGYTEADFAQLISRSRPSWWSRWVGGKAKETFPSRLAFEQDPGRTLSKQMRPQSPGFNRWETGCPDSPSRLPQQRQCDDLGDGFGTPASPVLPAVHVREGPTPSLRKGLDLGSRFVDAASDVEAPGPPRRRRSSI